MNKDYYVHKHYLLQHGCFFSSFYSCDSSLYTYSDLIDCFIWNHSIPISLSKMERERYLNNVIQFYSTRNRKACVYLDSDTSDSGFIALLNANGFKCVDNEAWMLWENRKETNDMKKLTMHIAQGDQMKDFLSVCSSCFEADYANAIYRDCKRFYCNKTYIHFSFYLGKQVVGIGSIYYDKDIAIIHNIGVLSSFRRQGYGSEIVGAVVQYIKSNICVSEILLQCDGGGYIESMYTNIGFKNIYRRLGYVRESDE